MKLIFSRKGFNSSAGGAPSPILPNGRMVSLPIPDKQSPILYGDITWDEGNIGSLVSDLTHGRIPPSYRAHLDPDLCRYSLPRLPGWRPIFGQTGAAQGHLRKSGVEEGDLFLFFGLFRRTVSTHGRFDWDTKYQPRHVIWGWMQIDEILSVDKCELGNYKWADYHPHFHRGIESNNSVYFSRKHLTLEGLSDEEVHGAGTFRFFSESLQLTVPSVPSPSIWELPEWFFPGNGRAPLTYHTDLNRWERARHRTRLRTAARGQEFVLDCNNYPEAFEWLAGLLRRNLKHSLISGCT
jgi:hypothetical protein